MMLALIAAASIASSGSAAPVHASGTASVRIVAGTVVHLSPAAASNEPQLVNASVRIETGERRPARLIEFQ